MKVIHVLNSNRYSGAENVAITIIKELNNEMDCLYACPRGPIEEILKKENIKYIPIKKLSIREINKVIKEYNPDIIHAHDFRASIICSRADFKGKIISHIHQTPTFLKTWNLKSILYYLSINKYQRIIGVTNAIVENCIFANKMKPKYMTICNCINKDEILKQVQGIEVKEVYDLAFFGRLEPVKNPIQFLQIIKDLKNQNLNIKAVILGDGTLMDECKKYIHDNGIEKNVKLNGFEKNPFPILNKTKIIVSTSIWEGIPMSILECGALKKPILNNGVGGLSEIFDKMQYMICKTNYEYEEKIKELLNDEEIYKKCEKQIETNMKQYYDIETYFNNIRKVYTE